MTEQLYETPERETPDVVGPEIIETEPKLPRGDHTPKIEELPDGSRRITTRVIRPQVSEIKSFEVKKAQIEAHQEFAAEMSEQDRSASYPDYRRDSYDYHELMPEIGSPDSIEISPDRPYLVIANVRHLPHKNNVVSPESQSDYVERATQLIEDLDITPNTLVYVVASPAANYTAGPIGATEAPTIHSRTESTVDVIRQKLDEMSIPHIDNDFGIEEPENSMLTSNFRRSLDEFQVEDRTESREAGKRIKANIEAQKAGEPLPYPESPTTDATVYASHAPDAQDLERKTSMTEVASATVARGLAGFDLLEDYFLKKGNIPDGVDKIVVITGRHGQFCTDITEALLEATDRAHPFAFAQNGAYSITEAHQTPDGEVAEDYIIQSGNRTGMVVK